MSEQERQWLLILSKAIRDSRVPTDAANIAKPANLLVLLCNKMAGIPPVFYQGNPAVHDVAVPMPGRTEREAFVKRTVHQWLLRKPLEVRLGQGAALHVNGDPAAIGILIPEPGRNGQSPRPPNPCIERG